MKTGTGDSETPISRMRDRIACHDRKREARGEAERQARAIALCAHATLNTLSFTRHGKLPGVPGHIDIEEALAPGATPRAVVRIKAIKDTCDNDTAASLTIHVDGVDANDNDSGRVDIRIGAIHEGAQRWRSADDAWSDRGYLHTDTCKTADMQAHVENAVCAIVSAGLDLAVNEE